MRYAGVRMWPKIITHVGSLSNRNNCEINFMSVVVMHLNNEACPGTNSISESLTKEWEAVVSQCYTEGVLGEDFIYVIDWIWDLSMEAFHKDCKASKVCLGLWSFVMCTFVNLSKLSSTRCYTQHAHTKSHTPWGRQIHQGSGKGASTDSFVIYNCCRCRLHKFWPSTELRKLLHVWETCERG